MSTYYGNWSTNNGNTFNGRAYIDTNKRRLRKDLRKIASGNLTGPNDVGHWSITDRYDNDILHGTVRW